MPKTAPNLPRLPAPEEEYDVETARDLNRILQTWMRHLILYTSDFYEGRFSTIQVLPQDFILRGSSDPTLTILQGNTYTYNFADAAVNEVFFTIQVPEAWNGDATIYPHIRWSPSDTGTGTIHWELEYTKAKTGAAFPSTTTLTVEVDGTGTDNEHVKTDINGTTGIDISGDDINTLIACRLVRDGTHGNDDYTAAAALHSIGFVFVADSLGSEQAFFKASG